jgi:hypothetical protein
MNRPFQTRTLAEIFAGQGYPGRALAIYEALHAISPEDGTLAARIAELRHILNGADRATRRVERLRALVARVKRRRRPCA